MSEETTEITESINSTESQYLQGFNDAINMAADICCRMVIGGRAWTEEQAIAADTLFAASKNIKNLKK